MQHRTHGVKMCDTLNTEPASPNDKTHPIYLQHGGREMSNCHWGWSL